MDQAAYDDDFLFGSFRLQPVRRVLLSAGVPVDLTSRAYDVLEFLVRNRDRIVTRDELTAHVWRRVVVGENNLSVQMSTLRKTLNAHGARMPMIISIPGRGYRFVASVGTPEPLESQKTLAKTVSSTSRHRTVLRWPVWLISGFLLTTAASTILIMKESHTAMPDPSSYMMTLLRHLQYFEDLKTFRQKTTWRYRLNQRTRRHG